MTKKMTTNGVIIAQHKYARARTTMMKKTTIIKADKGMLSTILLQIEDTETIRDQRPEAPIEVAKEAADFEDAIFFPPMFYADSYEANFCSFIHSYI